MGICISGAGRYNDRLMIQLGMFGIEIGMIDTMIDWRFIEV